MVELLGNTLNYQIELQWQLDHVLYVSVKKALRTIIFIQLRSQKTTIPIPIPTSYLTQNLLPSITDSSFIQYGKHHEIQ